MTSHELAKLLLEGPDEDIYLVEYAGGNDEVREVQSVKYYEDEYTSPYLIISSQARKHS